MRELDELVRQLARMNTDCMARWEAPGVRAMATIAERSLKRAGSRNLHLGPSGGDDRIVQAVRRFRESNGDVDHRTLRLVAHGCCRWIEADDYAIIARRLDLETLLRRVDANGTDLRKLRRFYLGLLSSYLRAERHAAWFGEAAKAGSEYLRQYLVRVRQSVADVQPPLVRLEVLNLYPMVLGTDPGQAFARDWLEGNSAAFTEVTEKLEISGASWLALDTLRAALAEATSAKDTLFKGHISAFLNAAGDQRFQPIRDEIYAGLITRYAAMKSPGIHPELRDALVAAWKNPWMSRNDGAWGRVPDHARNMVASWLKLELIHQFFAVLSDEGRQDRRRFEFWRTYHEQIDDVYFALGSNAYSSRNPDLVKLRKSLEGRLLALTDATPNTHAFVMCMGDTVVVEFSTSGNAAHKYSRARMPILAGEKHVSVGSLRLKDAGGVERLIHRDAASHCWEDEFHRRLSGPVDVLTFARAHNIPIEDRRSRGGAIWLTYFGQDPAVVGRLKAEGFSLAQGKGWWRTR